MKKMETLSLALFVLLPFACLIAAIGMQSMGFFFYSLPGAIAPGLALYLITYFQKKATTQIDDSADFGSSYAE